MNTLALPWPGVTRYRMTKSGSRLIANLLCGLIIAVSLVCYWVDMPWAIWLSLPPALWVAFESPQVLVALLLLMTPTFPVLRVIDETLGSREVSSRGLFLAADDPVIIALTLAWVWRLLQKSSIRQSLFPQSIIGLAILYPAVIAVNLMRLEWQQCLMSLLYYLKWAEYAGLLFIIPGLIGRAHIGELLRRFRLALVVGAIASACFAVYEVSESVRTHTYSQAALYPRASSFFGTLDPLRFGASEDPVNFGCYLIVAGSISLAFTSRARTAAGGMLAAAASFLGVVLSVSRAPILGAAIAYVRLQKVRAGKTVLSLLGLGVAAGLAALLFPEVTQTVIDRFTMVIPTSQSIEGSATDRLSIVLNSPVFEIDAFWLIGHGHSSYRFISEQHLSTFMTRLSRSLYNFPMTIWYDVGILGLFFWGTLFVQLNRYFGRISAHTKDPLQSALAEGLRAALLGLLVASMFSEIPYNWRVMGFFYNAAGVCLAAAGANGTAGRRLATR